MESAVKEAEVLAAGEAQRVGEIEKSLKAELAALKAQASEKEELLRIRESALKGFEEGFNAKTQDLEGKLREKGELLEVRDGEIKDLKSKVDMLVNLITRVESTAKEAEALAAGETQRAEEIERSFKAELAALKAQAGNKEDLLRTVRELEESTAKIRDLENRLKEKERIPDVREAEVKDLQSEVEMSRVRAAQMECIAKEGASEAQRVEELERSLRAEMAALKAQLKEREEQLQAKGSVGLEEGLAAKIHDLKDQLRDKEKLLEVREEEVKDLKSKVEMFGVRAAQMESMVKEAASESHQAEEIERSFKAELDALKAQLSEKEELLQVKESASKELEEKLAGKIYDLEDQLVENKEVLELRESDVKHLQFKLALKADEADRDNTAEVEQRLAEGYSLVESESEEARRLQAQMTEEIEKLRAELKEKKIVLAEKEREEWRSKKPAKFWKQMLIG
jgi:hypothetical protein